MFQSSTYEGGFDGIGMEFVFSLHLNDKEFWFHLTLDEIYKVYDRQINEVEITEADW